MSSTFGYRHPGEPQTFPTSLPSRFFKPLFTLSDSCFQQSLKITILTEIPDIVFIRQVTEILGLGQKAHRLARVVFYDLKRGIIISGHRMIREQLDSQHQELFHLVEFFPRIGAQNHARPMKLGNQ